MKRTFIFVLLLTFLGGVPTLVAADSSTWTLTTGSMSVARSSHTATLLTNGKVLIVGGFSVPSAELYDPATDSFSPTTSPPVVTHGSNSTATRLADGTVLIVGGSSAQNIAEIYDPVTDSFLQTFGNLNVFHTAHTATLLPDGKVLIAGGQDQNFLGGPQTTDVAELYDPVTRTFAFTTGILNVDRSTHAATLLPNGDVLIVGGSQTTTPGFGVCLNSAEVYNLALGTFSTTAAPMTGFRCRAQASLLGDGQVLIVGGFFLVSAELFDPLTSTFSSTGIMSTPHAFAPITMLSSGQVLAISGVTAGGPITTSSVELYDPASETFTVSGSLSVARLDHTATLLQDGRVLVTGGFNNPIDGNLTSAELGVITISVTKTFSAAAPKQTYSYDDGNHTLTVNFVDGVLQTFDLTITAVATVPGSLALDPLVFPPGTNCFPYATTGDLCVVYRAEEPLPSPGSEFTGSFDILIKYFDPVPAPANPRMAHDFSGIPGDEFTEDMTNAFFPSLDPDTDPALRGRTINWSEFVAVDLAITDPATFIGFLEPLGAGGKVFKSGRTIPVKFQLTDSTGNPVTDAVAHISVAKTSNNADGPVATDVEASGAANTDNLFRFDGDKYIYNLSTKGFTPGTYLLTVISTKFFPQTVTFVSR